MSRISVTREAGVLDHPDEHKAVLEPDVHVGGVSAAVAERVGADGKSDAVAFLHAFGSLAFGQFEHSRFGQDAMAVEFAVIEECFRPSGPQPTAEPQTAVCLNTTQLPVVKSFPRWVRFPRRSGSDLHADLQTMAFFV